MRTITLLALVLIFGQVRAEKEKYTKLFDMYTLEKYDKCIDAALKYTKSEKTAKDAEPYLYVAMSYFEISKDPDRFDLKKNPELKDPMRKAINYTARMAKKDKDGSVREENSEFMEELKEAAADAIKGMYADKETSKLATLSRDYAKAYDKDYAVMLYSGIYLIFGNSQSDGNKNLDIAMENLKKASVPDGGWDRISKRLLTDGFVLYSGYLMDAKDKKKAQSVLDVAKALLPDSEEITEQQGKLNQ
jgi:hypothetical protein